LDDRSTSLNRSVDILGTGNIWLPIDKELQLKAEMTRRRRSSQGSDTWSDIHDVGASEQDSMKAGHRRSEQDSNAAPRAVMMMSAENASMLASKSSNNVRDEAHDDRNDHGEGSMFRDSIDMGVPSDDKKIAYFRDDSASFDSYDGDGIVDLRDVATPRRLPDVGQNIEIDTSFETESSIYEQISESVEFVGNSISNALGLSPIPSPKKSPLLKNLADDMIDDQSV
jgi:hypothetical protein